MTTIGKPVALETSLVSLLHIDFAKLSVIFAIFALLEDDSGVGGVVFIIDSNIHEFFFMRSRILTWSGKGVHAKYGPEACLGEVSLYHDEC